MTKGLLISRLEKIRLSSLAAKNPSSESKDVYKRYKNLYNTVLRTGKKLYYEKELKKNVSILKKTWELVKSATILGALCLLHYLN
jgi:hypothetical protein